MFMCFQKNGFCSPCPLRFFLRFYTGFSPRPVRSTGAPSSHPFPDQDLFSAAGLPLRASVGFLVYPALQEKRPSVTVGGGNPVVPVRTKGPNGATCGDGDSRYVCLVLASLWVFRVWYFIFAVL